MSDCVCHGQNSKSELPALRRRTQFLIAGKPLQTLHYRIHQTPTRMCQKIPPGPLSIDSYFLPIIFQMKLSVYVIFWVIKDGGNSTLDWFLGP
jgi:hypothetical protein